MFPPPRRRIEPTLLAMLAAICVVFVAGVARAAVAAPGRVPSSVAPSGTWTWPLPPPHVVVAPFAPPSEPWLPGQRGVVLAGRPGERVLAAGAGVVGFAGRVGRMPVVTIVHGPLRTTYEPVSATVRRGQRVGAGAVIGRLLPIGSECPPRTCLHWGLLRGSAYLDPMSLLNLTEVRLLPVT